MKELGRDPQRLRILGTCSIVGLRQLKRSITKYEKWRTNMSLSSTQWCSKETESLESDNSWTKGWYLGEPEWRTIKGNGWENLQPNRNGFRSLGKNDSKEDSQKAKSKRKKALKEKRVNVSYLKWKVSKWLLGKQD